METISVNVVGRTRRETLNGREHIVAPLTLIVPGVLNGSRGALLYPQEEIDRDPAIWNGTPIVVYHPVQNGVNVSARRPDVLNKSGIGFIFEAKSQGKLIAEGWFDVEKTRAVDQRVLNALERGEALELSTGLFTDNEKAEGTFGGKTYSHIARNYRPDHLAILPDQIGACSLRDGCGVLNAETPNLFNRLSDYVKSLLPGAKVVVDNANPDQERDELGRFASGGGGSGEGAFLTDKSQYHKAKAGDTVSWAGKTLKVVESKPHPSGRGTIVKVETSDGRVVSLGTFLNNTEAKDPPTGSSVTRKSGGSDKPNSAFRPARSKDLVVGAKVRTSHGDGEITDGHDGRNASIWFPDIGQNLTVSVLDIRVLKKQTTNKEEPVMAKLSDDERKGLVAKLAVNCDCDKDREALNALSDETLKKLSQNAHGKMPMMEEEEEEEEEEEDTGVPPRGNATGKKPPFVKNKEEQTANKLAPASERLTPDEQEAIEFAREIQNERKQTAIKTITANKANKFTKEQLERFDLPTLNNLAALAKPATVKMPEGPRFANYGGAAAPTANGELTANDRADFLPLPSLANMKD